MARRSADEKASAQGTLAVCFNDFRYYILSKDFFRTGFSTTWRDHTLLFASSLLRHHFGGRATTTNNMGWKRDD
jgi:hypothetical protein